jgi:hypothetical protein
VLRLENESNKRIVKEMDRLISDERERLKLAQSQIVELQEIILECQCKEATL